MIPRERYESSHVWTCMVHGTVMALSFYQVAHLIEFFSCNALIRLIPISTSLRDQALLRSGMDIGL